MVVDVSVRNGVTDGKTNTVGTVHVQEVPVLVRHRLRILVPRDTRSRLEKTTEGRPDVTRPAPLRLAIVVSRPSCRRVQGTPPGTQGAVACRRRSGLPTESITVTGDRAPDAPVRVDNLGGVVVSSDDDSDKITTLVARRPQTLVSVARPGPPGPEVTAERGPTRHPGTLPIIPYPFQRGSQ